MNTPLVSWLMTVYNNEQLLPRALSSMLNQTYELFEVVVVVEFNCTDGTLEICEQFACKDERLRVYVNEAHLGFAQSLNRGLTLCKGKYIARMDADDVSHEDRLEKQVDYMERNLDVDILATQARVISPESEHIMLCLDPESIRARLLLGNCIPHTSTMIRAERLLHNSWFYTDCEAEDYMLWSSLISKAKIHFLSETLVDYHIHGDNACVVRVDQVRKTSAEISRRAILTELGLDVTHFPDILFGWRSSDLIPHDSYTFLSQSADLLRMINCANKQLCKFENYALENVLTDQWQTSKRIARMNILSDDYMDFSEENFNDAVSRYISMDHPSTKMVIYGVGNYTTHVLQNRNHSTSFEITAFVDSDKSKQGKTYEGLEVLPPEYLLVIPYSFILIGTSHYFDEVKQVLINRMRIPEDRIYDLNIVNDVAFHSQRRVFC